MLMNFGYLFIYENWQFAMPLWGVRWCALMEGTPVLENIFLFIIDYVPSAFMYDVDHYY